MKTIITTFSAIAVAATVSFAEEKPPGGRPGGPGGGPDGKRPNPEEIFKKLDANNDGAVSLDEFKAGPIAQRDPSKAEEVFKKIDKDGNGSVSLEEFKAGRPPRPGGGPGSDGKRPGGPDGDRGSGRGPRGPKPPQ